MKFSRAEFFDEENRVRNALKHFDQSDVPVLTVDIEDAACWLLVRACENAQRLKIDVKRFDDFDHWFYENVVGGA